MKWWKGKEHVKTCDKCGGTGYMPLVGKVFYLIPQDGKTVRKCSECVIHDHVYNQSEDEHFVCCECGREEDEMVVLDLDRIYCEECFDKEYEERD